MSWSKSLSGFADEQEKSLTAELRAKALQALTMIFERSPVGDATYWLSKPPAGYVGGRFRGNNIVTAGETTNRTDEVMDKSGNTAMTQGRAAIAATREPFTYITIQNNLPYAEALENGHSRQAPLGIYSVTFEALKHDF